MPEQSPHSMCVTIRLNSETLEKLEQECGDKTLSAMMNARICGVLSGLAYDASKETGNEEK